MKKGTKSRFELAVTSYGRKKKSRRRNKNQEKANNSPSYRCAAINKEHQYLHFLLKLNAKNYIFEKKIFY